MRPVLGEMVPHQSAKLSMPTRHMPNALFAARLAARERVFVFTVVDCWTPHFSCQPKWSSLSCLRICVFNTHVFSSKKTPGTATRPTKSWTKRSVNLSLAPPTMLLRNCGTSSTLPKLKPWQTLTSIICFGHCYFSSATVLSQFSPGLLVELTRRPSARGFGCFWNKFNY